MANEHIDLLPSNATDFERLFAEIRDPIARLGAGFDSIRDADVNPPPQFLPFLAWQYGLGELTPYLPNLYDLIADGVRWQRIRGTKAAILKGLGWVGYAGSLEEEPPHRRRWNRFQWALDRVRDDDVPDLARIAGIVQLSVPERSKFFRGFAGYDIRCCETSQQMTGGSLTGDHSGVRIAGVAPKWSFGRTYEAELTLSQEELEDAGAWIEPVDAGALWVDGDYLWAGASFAWDIPAYQARLNAIAGTLAAQSAWVRFRRADDSIIGHARAFTHPVVEAVGGPYQVGTQSFTPFTSAPTALLASARSGFGNGAGAEATSMSVVFGGTLTDAAKPGVLWIGPSGLSGGAEVATTAVEIAFGLTVREHCCFLLRF